MNTIQQRLKRLEAAAGAAVARQKQGERQVDTELEQRLKQVRLGMVEALLRPPVPGLQPLCRSREDALSTIGCDEKGNRVHVGST